MFMQKANYRRTKFNHRKIFWSKRRGGGYDEELDVENQDFLNQVLIDKYSVKDSPLRDAPWKKGEFDPTGM